MARLVIFCKYKFWKRQHFDNFCKVCPLPLSSAGIKVTPVQIHPISKKLRKFSKSSRPRSHKLTKGRVEIVRVKTFRKLFYSFPADFLTMLRSRSLFLFVFFVQTVNCSTKSCRWSGSSRIAVNFATATAPVKEIYFANAFYCPIRSCSHCNR